MEYSNVSEGYFNRLLEGYRIASKTEHYQNTAPHNNTCSSPLNYNADFWWVENVVTQALDKVWQVTAFVMLDSTNNYLAMTNSLTATNWAAYDQEYLTTTNLVGNPPTVTSLTNYLAPRAEWSCGLGNMIRTGGHGSRHLWPWEVDTSLRFGKTDYYGETVYTYPTGCGNLVTEKFHSQIWVDDTGEMEVNWPLHYPTDQKVLLTFEHVEYTLINGEDPDPTKIKYNSQAPDVIETNWHGVDVTANFYRYPAGAASDGVDIPAGQHTWRVRVADRAGNVASNMVTFTATGTTNTDAPVISNLNLSNGGVTVLPASSEVWVQGKVTGIGTTVAASINGGEPILMNRRGEDFGYLLPLQAGTNVIVLVATAAAQPQQQSRHRRLENGGNSGQAQSSTLAPVLPGSFNIWGITPELGTFCDGHPMTVAGYMDATYQGAAVTNVTVNGQEGGLGTMNDGTTTYCHFSATLPCQDKSEMTVSLTLYLADGTQQTFPFWYLEGYRIASKTEHYQNTAPHNNTCSSAPDYNAIFYWIENVVPGALDKVWQVTAFVMRDETNSYAAMTNSITVTNWASYYQEYLTTTNLVGNPPTVSDITTNHWAPRGAWSCGLGNMIPTGSHDSRHLWPWEVDTSLRFGKTDYSGETVYTYPTGCGDRITEKVHSQIWVDDTGEMEVNWPLHYTTNQQVLLTFEHVEYTRLNGEAPDPTQIKYQGQVPDVIETNYYGCFNLGYIVSVGDTSFKLNKDAFTWPTSDVTPTDLGTTNRDCMTTSGSASGSAHHLGFASFHNAPFTPKIIQPKGDADATNNPIDSWIGAPSYRFDFQGVTKKTPNFNAVTIQGQVDESGSYQWTLSDGGTLSSATTLNPNHNLPDTITEDIKGTLTFTETIGDTSVQTQKKIMVYRDHLARDIDNFGTMQSCNTGTVSTPYGKNVSILNWQRCWNCFGSVQHACDGTGDGYIYPPEPPTQGGHSFTNGGVYPYSSITSAFINVRRGAVVGFFVRGCSVLKPGPQYDWVHSAIFTGQDDLLWGANNSALDQNGNETWKFATRHAKEIMDDYRKKFSACSDFYIIILN